ncbi:hypothetical protein HanIR_Chr15g0781201 [Helianthus annuus]|nr:hypothetical protein HanIR_Chr15g0781201 [Helianthus annuus]
MTDNTGNDDGARGAWTPACYREDNLLLLPCRFEWSLAFISCAISWSVDHVRFQASHLFLVSIIVALNSGVSLCARSLPDGLASRFSVFFSISCLKLIQSSVR